MHRGDLGGCPAGLGGLCRTWGGDHRNRQGFGGSFWGGLEGPRALGVTSGAWGGWGTLGETLGGWEGWESMRSPRVLEVLGGFRGVPEGLQPPPPHRRAGRVQRHHLRLRADVVGQDPHHGGEEPGGPSGGGGGGGSTPRGPGTPWVPHPSPPPRRASCTTPSRWASSPASPRTSSTTSTPWTRTSSSTSRWALGGGLGALGALGGQSGHATPPHPTLTPPHPGPSC